MKKYTVLALTTSLVTAVVLGISTIGLFAKNTHITYKLENGKNYIEIGALVRRVDIESDSTLSDFTLSINSKSNDLTINFNADVGEYFASGTPLVKSKGKLTLNFVTKSDISITAADNCNAIIADTVYIKTQSNLSIFGSDGSSGQDGETGKSGSNGNEFDGGYKNAGNGTKGTDGTDGFAAISCKTLYLVNDYEYLFRSGNGGNGGNGGKGGSGPNDSWLFFSTVVAANAGNGGDGGNGGNGGSYGGIEHIYNFKNDDLAFKEVFYFAGLGGKGGKGGIAGTPGTVTNTSIFDHSTVKGKEGKNGNNGQDGINGQNI